MDQHQTDKIALLERRVADLEDHLARETRSSQAANARAEDYERQVRELAEQLATAHALRDRHAAAYAEIERTLAAQTPERGRHPEEFLVKNPDAWRTLLEGTGLDRDAYLEYGEYARIAIWVAPDATIHGRLLRQDGGADDQAARLPDPAFEVDEAGYVIFWADGEEAPCERLRLQTKCGADGFVLDYTLIEGDDLHDGHDSIQSIADAFPSVAVSLEDWKADRLVPFERVLEAARAADARRMGAA